MEGDLTFYKTKFYHQIKGASSNFILHVKLKKLDSLFLSLEVDTGKNQPEERKSEKVPKVFLNRKVEFYTNKMSLQSICWRFFHHFVFLLILFESDNEKVSFFNLKGKNKTPIVIVILQKKKKNRLD